MVHKVMQVLRVMMVHKEHRVTKDKQELMLVKVLKEHKVIREILEQETRVLKVLQELEVILALKVLRDTKGHQELMLVKVLKVLLEHKVLKGIKETKERQALIQTFQLEQ